MSRIRTGTFAPATARPARRGAALVWAVVILALLAGLLQLSVRHVLAGRRQLDRRHSELQAGWLARAGLEQAAARLLAAPANYAGESLTPIPGAQVRIEVKKDPGRPDTYRVTSEARYPTAGNPVIVYSLRRRFRRQVEAGRVRIEVLAREPEAKIGFPPFFLGPL